MKVNLTTIPKFDRWRFEQESERLAATVDTLQTSLPGVVFQINEHLAAVERRLSTMEKAQERLQLLLSAIQRDLPEITKTCPHVLAVAANIAIEDGGLDKP